MRRRLTAPVIIDFNITQRCNLKCKFCYANASSEKQCLNEMNIEEIKKLFDEFNSMNIHVIRITGGEPFVRNDIKDIIKLTEGYNFAVCMNTNGTLITDANIDLIAESKIVNVGISLDGYNSSIHEKIRGVEGSFDKTVEVIKKLVIKSREKICITYTLTNENCYINFIKKAIAFNEQIGVKSISFQLTAPVGRCAQERNCVPTYEQWKEVFLWLTDYKKNKGKMDIGINPTNEGEVFWEFYLPLQKSGQLHLLKEVWGQDLDENFVAENISCVAGNVSLAIACNGDVYPCELMMAHEEFCLGNALKDGFKNILDRSEIIDIIFNMKKSDLSGKCSNCELKFCGGGCRAVAYACSGKLNAIDIRCPISVLEE